MTLVCTRYIIITIVFIIIIKHSLFGSQTLETGFSGFHYMIYTILKKKFNKVHPKVIKYQDYSTFSGAKFFSDLSSVANRGFPGDYDK